MIVPFLNMRIIGAIWVRLISVLVISEIVLHSIKENQMLGQDPRKGEHTMRYF